jgi:nucleoside-triphosphatase THEP1
MVGRSTVILVAGKAGVGKSTFSKVLYDGLKEKGYTVDLVHFASTLKRIASDLCGGMDVKM